MRREDRDDLLALLRAKIGDRKKNPSILFEYLVQDAVVSGPPLKEPELLFKLFPNHEIKSIEVARDKIAADENSQVRKAKAQLMAIFSEFESSQAGKRHPLSIRFKDKSYAIEFIERDASVRRFWRPYLDAESTQELLLVYPENVFYRNLERRYFIRHLDVNSDVGSDMPRLRRMVDFSPDTEIPLQYARQFVSSGDVSALLFLTRWFERVGVLTDHSVAHQTPNNFLARKNLIIFGNLRTYPLVHSLTRANGFNFEIDTDRIVNRSAIPSDPPRDAVGESESDQRHFYRDQFGAPGTVRGLVYRFFERSLGGWITIIASNSGRFHEAMAHSLVSEVEASQFVSWLTESNEEADPPKRFEALLEVGIERGEETPRPTYQVRPLAKRVY